MGPPTWRFAGYGGGTLGRNPFDWMEMVRRTPQGAVATFWASMRGLITLSTMAIILGQHVRVGNEDNLWGSDKKRRSTVQQIEGAVRVAREFGRKVATADEAREIMKVGVWSRQHRADPAGTRPAAESQRRQGRLPVVGH